VKKFTNRSRKPKKRIVAVVILEANGIEYSARSWFGGEVHAGRLAGKFELRQVPTRGSYS
jgi:hypothetical protein